MSEVASVDTGGEPVLVLPAVLDFSAADGLLAAARQLAGRACLVDGAAVTRFSTPCAQILLALGRRPEPMTLLHPSEQLISALGELGILDQFKVRIDPQ